MYSIRQRLVEGLLTSCEECRVDNFCFQEPYSLEGQIRLTKHNERQSLKWKLQKKVQRFQDTERRAGLKALSRYFCCCSVAKSSPSLCDHMVLYLLEVYSGVFVSRDTKFVCDLILQLFALSLTEWAASTSWVSGPPTTQSQDRVSNISPHQWQLHQGWTYSIQKYWQ